MFKEFRDFIVRGNVIDLAVGIIIGAAFTSVVNSLVNDILMPPIGYMMGGMDFSELALNLGKDVTINYGLFINALINFLIVALAMFAVVKGFNAMVASKKQEEKAQEAQQEEVQVPADPSVEERLIETLNRLNDTLQKN